MLEIPSGRKRAILPGIGSDPISDTDFRARGSDFDRAKAIRPFGTQQDLCDPPVANVA